MSRAPTQTPNNSSNARNEYIPSFISQKPFYVDSSDADYLEHQRLQSAPKDTLDKAKWYDRGRKLGPAATKFRKGACENCGAMTHKTKECLSRPRKQGAKWTGRDIQADEALDKVELGWDAKRDRWNGYDSREYSAVMREYEELENLKRASKGHPPADQNGDTTPTADSGAATPQDDLRYGEETDMGRSQPTSTRQLRLREDTAAYLRDLNLDSAKYDPKTRSMDTSTVALNSAVDPSTADDGFVRKAATEGDALEFERAQRHAWDSQESGGTTTGGKKLHLQANPTEGEILRKKLTIEAEAKKAAHRKALLEKYGGVETLNNPSPSPSSTNTTTAAAAHTSKPSLKTPIPTTSTFTEYDPTTGLPLSSSSSTNNPTQKQLTHTPSSKYPEDIHPGNHTSVWGSWFSITESTWGYRCCHATTRNAYCTGEEGKKALEESVRRRLGDDEEGAEFERHPAEEQIENLTADDNDIAIDIDNDTRPSHPDTDDEAHPNKSKRRPANHDRNQPPVQETKSKKRARDETDSTRGISSEEMEAYKRSRGMADDPMAAHLGKDELLPAS